MTPACPITATQDALILLRSGRAAMALHILEGLPALIEAQLVDARGLGFAEGWDVHLIAPQQRASGRETAPGRPAAPPPLMAAALAAPTGHYRPPAAGVGL
jgi:hypothetical protein